MPPRYSIVIPTRNRADLLKLAVRTVIAQSFDDYEVLVSDNASADHTAQVIASFRDSRIRSVRTPTSLVMPESWAFALSHARGEYVMFLCDDDALHPRALASIDAVANQTNADVIYWRWCHYQHADWSGSAGQDIFSFGPPFSDRVFNVNAERLLECAYDMRLSHNANVPRMLNTAVHRSAIDRAREGSNGLGAQAPAANGIFRPASPDWAAMVALCAHAKRMAFLDAPLLVAGACAQSIGASATRRDEAARAYLRDIRARYPNLILPATTATLHCWMAQVFMQCAADMKLPGKAVNSVHMLGLAGQELAEWDRIGVRTDDLRAEFEHAVNELRIEDQEEVARIICGKIVLFSEEFLGTEVKCRVLGNGARVVEGGQAKAEGFESIVDFAVGIDQW
ncbi:MAG TPA: glycosyltransferase, partial [Phycisphaerales bacterium]|nr:glycosyltransferase [Phycisphaerales bacterium]